MSATKGIYTEQSRCLSLLYYPIFYSRPNRPPFPPTLSLSLTVFDQLQKLLVKIVYALQTFPNEMKLLASMFWRNGNNSLSWVDGFSGGMAPDGRFYREGLSHISLRGYQGEVTPPSRNSPDGILAVRCRSELRTKFVAIGFHSLIMKNR